jgi:glycosyltransferase involved in cell wall biosynthesis
MLVKLMERFDRSVISAAVISLRGEGTHGRYLREIGIRVECLNLSGLWRLLSATTKLRALVREFQPNVIQGWMYHGNVVARLAGCFARDAAVVWSVRHSLHSLEAERWFMRALIRLSVPLSRGVAACIYPSVKACEQHLALGFRSDNAVLIPNGFDLARFRPMSYEERSGARNAIGVGEGDFLIAHVARFHPMKDHLGFLRAISQVVRRKSNVRVAMAGLGVSESNSALSSIIDELGLRNHVFLLGELRDVGPLLGSADCLCVSSAWGEAFPNVIGEAMATGTPCVVTDVGDSAAIVGDCGFAVPPSDINALAAALERLEQMSPNERHLLGCRARDRVTASFSIEKIARAYQNCYVSIVGSK